MGDEEKMEEGDAVVLYSAKRKFNGVFLKRNKRTRVFGIMKDLTELVGQPYGSVYELNHGTDKPKRLHELAGRESAQTVTDGRDNRDVVDVADNQRLSMEDIEDLKAKAEDGSAIVEALVENSETFERKTEFAQEKYLSRKVKKYCTTFSALKPTAATICETQFDWYAVKASFLRADTLAAILSLANVGAHRRVLVVDNCMGLLAAAVEERLGGRGDICVGYFGKKPCKLETLKRFSPEEPANLYKVPLVDLIELKQQQGALEADQPSEAFARKRSVPSETLNIWLDRGFDSCILADWKIDPCTLIDGVLPLLAPSASFVIYSAGLTSLVECQHQLMRRKDVVMVELQDLWWREYQVLPGRTRPTMDAKCPSGYLLSGTKVLFETCPAPSPSEDTKQQSDCEKVS